MEERQLPCAREIASFRFYSAAGGTIVGFYVDRDGTNLGSFSSTIPAAATADITGGTATTVPVPSSAVGAYVKATGTIAYAPGSAGTDLATNSSRYPTVSTSSFLALGVAA